MPSPLVGEGVVSICETTGGGCLGTTLHHPPSTRSRLGEAGAASLRRSRVAGTFPHKGGRFFRALQRGANRCLRCMLAAGMRGCGAIAHPAAAGHAGHGRRLGGHDQRARARRGKLRRELRDRRAPPGAGGARRFPHRLGAVRNDPGLAAAFRRRPELDFLKTHVGEEGRRERLQKPAIPSDLHMPLDAAPDQADESGTCRMARLGRRRIAQQRKLTHDFLLPWSVASQICGPFAGMTGGTAHMQGKRFSEVSSGRRNGFAGRPAMRQARRSCQRYQAMAGARNQG